MGFESRAISARVTKQIVALFSKTFDKIHYLGLGRESCLSVIVYSLVCCFCSKEFLLPLGAWERLRYIIVALPGPSSNYFKFAAKKECVK